MSKNTGISGKWLLPEVATKFMKVAQESNRKTAEAILAEANKGVPYDKGDLQASGKVVEGKDGEYGVTYTGDQAVRLHEHPEYNFQNGRHGKWLERAIQQHGKIAIMEAIKAIKSEMR